MMYIMILLDVLMIVVCILHMLSREEMPAWMLMVWVGIAMLAHIELLSH